MARPDATIHDVAIALGEGFPEETPTEIAAARAAANITRPVREPSGPLRDPASKVPAQRDSLVEEILRSGAPPATAGSPAAQKCPGVGYPPVPIDYALLKQSFATTEPAAEKAISYFYSLLFTASPELRGMFPLAMDAQRKAMRGALARCVWSMDDSQSLHEYLGQVARDHRKYGVQEKHYDAFGGALLAALRLVNGDGWTEETAAAWTTAVGHISSVMHDAAHQAASQPAWWVAEVTGHDRRCGDLAVLTIRPSQPFPYQPGQYLSVQVPRCPRVWREYSIANAPRPDGSLDLHVRAIPGGQVSTSLVQQTRSGDTILLGPARGAMVADHSSARDLLCIAGGTGLAPIKAIIEGLTSQPAGPAARKIRLFVGARRRPDLYDLPDLARLQSACPGLEVTTALSEDPGAGGLHGLLPDVVRQRASWQDCDVFVSGPPAMVRATLRVLGHRASGEHLHLDRYADTGDRLRG